MKAQLVRDDHFEKVAEGITPDNKRRITLGKALLDPGTHFNIYRNHLGQIVLDPRKDVPAYEAWVFENTNALAALKRGLRQSASGKTRYLGSFAKHAAEKSSEEK